MSTPATSTETAGEASTSTGVDSAAPEQASPLGDSKGRSTPAKPAHVERNPGMPLDLDWVEGARVNLSAIQRRCATLGTRRTVKKDWQVAWMLKAITCIDLTTLSGDDTLSNVQRLCAKARNPVRKDILAGFGADHLGITTGAVCVYHEYVKAAVQALKGTGIPVAAVSTGFPAGLIPFELRIKEIDASVSDGAEEIDIVITRRHVLSGDWQALYDEVSAFRKACGSAHIKTILATGELATLRNIYQASLVCMMAGADFIKTSTGKEPVNAVLPFGLTMVRAIRAYAERTGYQVGFKPAGGIKTAKDALVWLFLMREELGQRYLHPDLFRFGASSLLADIERQLEFHLTGRYSADFRHPMG